ncbi:hypothetical protein BGZ76_004050 [Entomortierella beljakovae]|nr:hypothetical protein BGZ76_004050 [Entomortierella beljakovae]
MAPFLEQFKNFIRHGKSGKDMKPRDTEISSQSSQQNPKPRSRVDSRSQSPSRNAFSNDHQNITSHQDSTATASSNSEAASRIVAEERQQKSKMPSYPGLERYRLIEKMGDGAFSNVYKAHDLKFDRVVAVKVVRKFELNASQRANILKEVQIMRQLKNPNIVELYDFSESDEHYFLVLELAPGGELFHRIVKLTYFSEELTRHVIVQVAHAIRYLHEEKGVIHRDIKPENILFEPIPLIPSPPGSKPDEDDKEDEGIFQPGVGGGGIGRVKIADFGLSKVVWNEQTMTPCGTVGYTAPEIVKDERYSKSVDMWAMGCVLYTLLCGFPPFYDESIPALTEKVARGQYTFLSPWWDEISLSVKDLITHLLCVNPAERYTIDQFLAHPWIKAGEVAAKPQTVTEIPAPDAIDSPGVSLENKRLVNVAAQTPEYGPKTPYRRRAENPLSPGIGLKEVFDVSNAVHRMEEESRRRTALHPVDALNTSTRQRQAFMSQLNEEEEEDDQSSYSDGSASMTSDDEAIISDTSNIKINVDGVNDQGHKQLVQQQQEYQKAQEEIAAEHHQKYLKQQQQAGHSIPAQHSLPSVISGSSNSLSNAVRSNQVGPSRSGQLSTSTSASTIASTSTTSTTRRRRAGFELNINQATLLTRRAKQTNHMSTVEQQDQNINKESPVLAI